MTTYSTVGIVTTYPENVSGNLYLMYNESVNPIESTGLYVEEADIMKGCFYCTREHVIRYNKYKSADGFWSIFVDDVQMAQKEYTNDQITVNNTTYVSNIVENNVTTQLTQVLGQDYSQQFSDLGNTIMSLQGSYSTLTQMLQDNTNIDTSQATTIWNNSSSIATLQVDNTNNKANIAQNTTDISTVRSGINNTLVPQLNKNTTDIKNVQDAATALQARVSSCESNILSNSSAVTALQSRSTTNETNITSNASAVTALQGRLTTDEANITSNTSAITTLNTNLAAQVSKEAADVLAIKGTGYASLNPQPTLASIKKLLDSINASIAIINSNTTAMKQSLGGLLSNSGNVVTVPNVSFT